MTNPTMQKKQGIKKIGGTPLMLDNQCHPYIPSTTVLGDTLAYVRYLNVSLRTDLLTRGIYRLFLCCLETPSRTKGVGPSTS